jgi:hypothetical protein
MARKGRIEFSGAVYHVLDSERVCEQSSLRYNSRICACPRHQPPPARNAIPLKGSSNF